MAAITYIFAIAGVFLVADAAILNLGIAAQLPWFTAAAAGFAGFLVAVVWYFEIKAKERAKKKRVKAFAAMFANLSVCIVAVAYLIAQMIQSAM